MHSPDGFMGDMAEPYQSSGDASWRAEYVHVYGLLEGASCYELTRESNNLGILSRSKSGEGGSLPRLVLISQSISASLWWILRQGSSDSHGAVFLTVQLKQHFKFTTP